MLPVKSMELSKLEEEEEREITKITDVVDPFKNDSVQTMPCYWKLVMASIGLTLFPIRLAILLLTFILSLVFLIPFSSCFDNYCVRRQKEVALAISGDHEESQSEETKEHNHIPSTQQHQPLNCCRSCSVYPLRLLSRMTLWCMGYWWITIDHLPNSAKKRSDRPVIVANHTSLLDAMVMMYVFAPMSVARSGVRKIPIVSNIAKALQTIYVDRKDPSSKKRTLQEIKRRTSNNRFPSLCVYPEGTTTNGKCLIQFKKGAFTSGKTVQPIVLQYTSTFLNVCANGDMKNMGIGFLIMMLQPYNYLKMTLLPVHKPTNKEIENPLIFANNVRHEMSCFMNIPVTEHSYEDLFFLTHLRETKQYGYVKQNFEMSKLKAKYDLTFNEIKLLLEKFAVIRETNLNYPKEKMSENDELNGRLNDHMIETGRKTSKGLVYEEFCSCLKINVNDVESEILFRFFDLKDNGVIEFVEFVRGISLLSGRINDIERLKLAFEMLDADKDGRIALSDLKQYLNDAVRVDHVKLAVFNGKEKKNDEKLKDVEKDIPGVDNFKTTNTLRQSSLDSCLDAIDDLGEISSDGTITLDEFIILAHKRTKLIGPLLSMAENLISVLDEQDAI